VTNSDYVTGRMNRVSISGSEERNF